MRSSTCVFNVQIHKNFRLQRLGLRPGTGGSRTRAALGLLTVAATAAQTQMRPPPSKKTLAEYLHFLCQGKTAFFQGKCQGKKAFSGKCQGNVRENESPWLAGTL